MTFAAVGRLRWLHRQRFLQPSRGLRVFIACRLHPQQRGGSRRAVVERAEPSRSRQHLVPWQRHLHVGHRLRATVRQDSPVVVLGDADVEVRGGAGLGEVEHRLG